MRIQKVLLNKARVFIEYERDNDLTGGVDKFTLESKEDPRPEFTEAMLGLKPFVLSLCELPDGYDETMDVRGVSFSYKKGKQQSHLGATITATRGVELTNSPFVIHTPHVTNLSGTVEEDQPPILEELYTALQKVVQEALSYVRGERAQLAMPLEQ